MNMDIKLHKRVKDGDFYAVINGILWTGKSNSKDYRS